MTKEEKLYIKECDCPEIQNRWKPKVGDRCFNEYICTERKVDVLFIIQTDIKGETKKEVMLNTFHHINKGGLIFLPSLDQLLDILGERLSHLALYKKVYRCVLNGKMVALRDLIYNGSTRKLACLLAVKEVLKEESVERGGKR